jgi:uncharacterized phage-associated protein
MEPVPLRTLLPTQVAEVLAEDALGGVRDLPPVHTLVDNLGTQLADSWTTKKGGTMSERKAADIAAYILREGPREALELQKLVYFVQAWGLAWDGVGIFDDRIEAWPMGPVAPDLWRRHRNQPFVTHVDGDASRLNVRAQATVDAVVAFYGRLGSSKLVEMTHDDKPWQDARGDLPAGARSSKRITEAAMRRYYTAQQVLGSPAPTRAAFEAAEAPLGPSMEQADQLIKSWRSTLDWLAVR